MQTNLTIFKFEDKQVRTVEIDGEIYFVGKDVCEVLGYVEIEKTLTRYFKMGGIRMTPIPDSLNRMQPTKVLTESQVYDLVLDSTKPDAKKFREWVVKDVVPSIRKTGKYEIKPYPILPDFTNPAVAARAWADEYEEKIKAQKQLEEQKPLVAYAEAMGVENTEDRLEAFIKAYSSNTGYVIGKNKLFKVLRSRLIFTQNNYPQEKYGMNGLKYFKVNKTPIRGLDEFNYRTDITPKGEKWLTNFLNEVLPKYNWDKR